MKLAKRILAVIMMAALAMALTIPAFAADEKGSITITGTAGTTYKVYCIFDVESHTITGEGESATKNVVYTVNNAWKNFINSTDGSNNNIIKGVYVDVDTDGYVTWIKKDADGEPTGVAEFAEKALAYAKEHKITETKSGKIEGTATSVTIPELDFGYYLVDSSMGALCALTTTAPNAEVKEKNEEPTIEKEVVGDTNVSTAGIGDIIEYKITIEPKKGAENYVLTDKMGTGLKYYTDDTHSLKVKVDDEEVTAGDNTYQLATTGIGDATFKITFNDAYVASLVGKTDNEANKKIEVTYYAQITSDAVIKENGNDNTAELEYGDKNKITSTTKTYVLDLTINKVDGNQTETADGVTTYTKYLGGAEFILYRGTGENKEYAKFDNLYKLTSWETNESNATTLVTSSESGEKKGKITVQGLAAGTYYLKETKAPAGYNKLSEPAEVKLSASKEDETVTFTSVGNTIVNKSGTELPETGGIGTTIFYVVGGFLAVGAVVLMVVKKRMSAE